MFGGVIDNVVMFSITVAIVCIGTVYFPRNWFCRSVNAGSETYFTAFAYTLLSLHACIAILQLAGLVGMYLGIVSVLWAFWQMFYLLSIGMVFRHIPILTLCAFLWSLVGWWRWHYSARGALLVLLLSLTLVVNVGLYIAFQALVRDKSNRDLQNQHSTQITKQSIFQSH